jgi:hypothetical protein
MRDRHFPRLCGHCHAPMARQEDACWSCGTPWVSEDGPRTALHAISEAPPAKARRQTDRWIDDGGGFKRAV